MLYSASLERKSKSEDDLVRDVITHSRFSHSETMIMASKNCNYGITLCFEVGWDNIAYTVFYTLRRIVSVSISKNGFYYNKIIIK